MTLFDELPAAPVPVQHRWQCTRCGRFVPRGTVRKIQPRPGEADEHEYQGNCRVHGRSDVIWPEP